jgi:predicted small lipoprotein YifL
VQAGRRWRFASKLAVWACFEIQENWRMRTTRYRAGVVLIAALLGLGIAACEKKGPLEQAAEEVDEAVSTLKNGGEEPVAAKIDDALDDASARVEKAAK